MVREPRTGQEVGPPELRLKTRQKKRDASYSEGGRMMRPSADAYARAGVDLRRVKAIHGSLAETFRSTFATRRGRLGAPLIGIGHYAGLIDLGDGRALAMHTDGVGTKVQVALQMRKYDTVGIDCVAMTVNDLICVGCEPVALLDYLALEREDEKMVSELMKGLVAGARESRTAIVGGETAIMGADVNGLDLVSMGVGIVDKRKILDGSKISSGDAVVGIASSGLHSNGYTLARRVLLAKHRLTDRLPELDGTLGDALLLPTRIYVKPALKALDRFDVHAMGHITGGSFTKLRRLVGGRRLGFDLSLPEDVPPIFSIIQKEGRLSAREMLSTFNMGVGLCVCAAPGDAEGVVSVFEREGFSASVIGRVSDREGVRVDGHDLSG